jgi:YesN/AraC family two-component response regulator
MYKVLLVDDERIILDGIARTVDWSALGTVLAGTAQNGLKAYERMAGLAPDIVVSDIRMPGMDGLELVAKAHESHPRVRFVLLSGFSEFEYAHRAMQYGVRHYLLKSTNETKIAAAIADLVGELDREARREALVSGIRQCLDKVRPHLKEQEVQSYLEETVREISARRERPEAAGYTATVRKVIEIVEQRLGDPELSLGSVAGEMLFLNADYLGKRFKKETGQKFSHYVMKARIRRAMELIAAQPDIKVFELAERLGFGGNPQYFSQVFKKYTGCTPSEYLRTAESSAF